MYILAIETTGPVGSVAVVCADAASEHVADPSVDPGTYSAVDPIVDFAVDPADAGNGRIPMKVTTKTMSHLKNLIPMTEELLSEEGIDKGEISAVAVSSGPGSFTGIRIGVSTARALAQAWGISCISVPSLEVFRQKCAAGQPVCVIYNARRGQVYGACYGADGEELIAPGPYMLTDMLSRIETLRISPVFYGDGVDAYFDTDEFRDRVSGYSAAPCEDRYQTAAMTAVYARDEGKAIEYGELLPDYMRESEAEQRLKDGSLEKMRKAKLERLMRMAGK